MPPTLQPIHSASAAAGGDPRLRVIGYAAAVALSLVVWALVALAIWGAV